MKIIAINLYKSQKGKTIKNKENETCMFSLSCVCLSAYFTSVFRPSFGVADKSALLLMATSKVGGEVHSTLQCF